MVSLDSRTRQTTTKQERSPVEEVLGLEDQFVNRHVDPTSEEIDQMLKALGFSSLDALIDETVPSSIRLQKPLDLPEQKSEHEALKQLRAIASENQVFRSFIGMGYYDCITPAAIQRNILENPGWYTAYTPYQPEIAQGRLEALLNFQTMVSDLTGLEIANSSLLDEATAAAEAMSMSVSVSKSKATTFFVSEECHPQTIEVLQTRAQPLGLDILVGNHREFDFSTPIFGALLQYPTTEGKICDYREFVEKAHEQKALVTVAADPLSLALLTPPGEWGADIAVGSSQRFGVPLGYGGPHAAYFATKEKYKRQLPGRLVGVSKDTQGKPALRLALQTREQHIRRDRATSNICTAQVLLAVIASMYGVYHGPDGIKRIAEKVHRLTVTLAEGLKRIGYTIASEPYFDTLKIETNNAPQTQQAILQAAEEQQINLRSYADGALGISLDEATTVEEVTNLLQLFAGTETLPFSLEELVPELTFDFPETFSRTSSYLTEAVFNQYHSETKLVRYLNHLQSKDLSLTTSMIPLGSCTMKLNAAAEMYPVTWAEFGKIHPFAPKSQTKGYQTLFEQLETWLSEITGFADISLQPNAGAQGEYTGLLVIRQYHQIRGQGHRNICLIPESGNGTNPASAGM
jgi:glycine dehydrogenase